MYCPRHDKPVGKIRLPVFLVAMTLLLMFASTRHAGSHKSRNILVLHSYHQGLQWTDSISAGIKSEFASDDGDIEIHYLYLDTKRHPGETYFKHLVEFERMKTQLANIAFELIISSDNNALRFIVDYGDDLYPDIPVIFCGINNFHLGLLKGKTRITGVVESIDYEATLKLMRKLHPKRKRVLVILDKTPTGEAIKKEFQMASGSFTDHFLFEYYQDFILEEVPQKISTLDHDDIVYMLTFNRDRKDHFISYVDGIRMVYNSSKAPIYGSWEFYYGNGIVGGMITSGFYQGENAAKLAKQILDGTPANEIPIITRSPNRYMFDYIPMARFGITTSQLPPGSLIINQPPSFFDQYKNIISIALGIVMAIALVLGWRLLVQRRRQLMLDRANRELDRRVSEQTAILEHKNALLENEIGERLNAEKNLIDKSDRLQHALSKVKTLSGLLPICASCKKIRDDKGYWNQIEDYIDEHSDATFSHGICPDCTKRLYPEIDLKKQE